MKFVPKMCLVSGGGKKLPPQRHRHMSINTGIRGRVGQRAAYWGEIKSRVTTHEGEILTGQKGREYARKYSKKYLGRDLSANGFRVDPNRVEEFEKTKR